MSRRLADSEHTARPWRIHEVAPDFHLEDVWAFRTPGAGRDDFPAVLAALRAAAGRDENPPVVRLLFAARWKLGALLGWDEPRQGLDGRVPALSDRLPGDLRSATTGEAAPSGPFSMVYELPDECAMELANETVHGICHLGWVPTGAGDYELRMAVLVKPNGLLGRLYLAAIKPFRYLIVYPALTRRWERVWRDRDAPQPGKPRRAAPAGKRRSPLIRWAGRLVVLFGAAHTIGALTVERAGQHAGAWFGGELWGEDLAGMSPANSAYWLSVNSFGPPLVLVGVTVLWMERRGITPPSFLAWALAGWTVVDTVVAGPGAGQGLILLSAVGLLLAGARRAAGRDAPVPHPDRRPTAGPPAPQPG